MMTTPEENEKLACWRAHAERPRATEPMPSPGLGERKEGPPAPPPPVLSLTWDVPGPPPPHRPEAVHDKLWREGGRRVAGREKKTVVGVCWCRRGAVRIPPRPALLQTTPPQAGTHHGALTAANMDPNTVSRREDMASICA